MKTRKRSGLITKFTLLTLVLVVVTSAGVGSYVMRQSMTHDFEQLIRHGRSMAAMAAYNSEYGIYTEDQDSLLQIVESLAADPDVAYVRVTDASGRVLAEKVLGPRVQVPAELHRSGAEEPDGVLAEEFFDAGTGEEYIDFLAPVASVADGDNDDLLSGIDAPAEEGRVVGHVQVGISQRTLRQQIRAFVFSTVLFTLLVIVLGVIVTVVMARRIASPVRKLVRVTRDISAGNLEQQLEIRTGDEIQELAESFNLMVRDLRSYREQEEDHKRSLEEKVAERTRDLQRATEEAVELAEQAEAASRAKSQFLANMSHEIRTPMNGVLGMTELLVNTRLSEKQHRFAETIRRSAEALLSVLNDILDFSKIEAGKLELEILDFDLRQEVEEVAELFAEHAYSKHLEFLCVIPPDTPKTVRGDAGRLRQVLTNLVGNALKFTDEGEIAVRVAVADEDEATLCVRFEIQDTGAGIAPEALEHIFESFTQADGSATRKHGGTGLGLTISKQLVEMMAGEIGVESEPGKGSTFWFTAHFGKPEAEDAYEAAHPSQIVGLHILVVDDNATNRELLELELGAWGARVQAAEGGPQGLGLLRAAAQRGEPFDVAILDLMMPEMDGFELARRIKADGGISAVHLVMLTSVGLPQEAEELRRLGIEVYLSKPVRQSHLYDSLMTVMSTSGGDPQRDATPDGDHLEDVRFQGRVLLVEDNRINQEVARDMIEMLGCQVEVANNGQEALDALARDDYDLVFMDCQMPEMDGYAATRAIREQEAAGNGGGAHLPIVALTAHAMDGDREKCLAAGMDDYLTKPFPLDQLCAVLGDWLAAAPEKNDRPEPNRPPATPATAPGAPLDPNALDSLRALERQGAQGLVRKAIRFYLEDAPKLIETLREAVSLADSQALSNAAHSLKSSSANLGAVRLAKLSSDLEKAGRAGATEGAGTLLAETQAEYERVSVALAAEGEE
jgi:signal transduction histidine kinase/DNA-binding response OmpR family regulator/HPt (histidine-containing phosphotransfer) domain-containing protein